MNLEDHLTTGTMIELSILKDHNKFMKFNTIIDKPYQNDIMSVATPMFGGRLYPLPVNSVVNINFLIEKEDGTRESLTFKAKVISRTMNDNSTITLQKVNELEANQRRDAFRMPYVEKISYYRNEKSIAKEFLTRNISATGLRGVIHEHLSANEVIMVELPLSDGNYFVYARVISADRMPDSASYYDVRLNYMEASMFQRDKIHRYILERQTEQLKKNVDRDGYSELYKQIEAALPVYPADFFSRATELTIFVSYAVLAIISIILAAAQPKANTGIERLFNFDVPYASSEWNSTLLYYVFYVSGFYMLLGALSLMFNTFRVRKYGEKYKLSIWLHLVCGLLVFAFSLYHITTPVK